MASERKGVKEKSAREKLLEAADQIAREAGPSNLSLAALRGGIKKVLIPEENAKDLAEIPENVKSGLEIIPVSRVGEVLRHALVRMPEPIEWVEPVEPAGAKTEDAGAASLAH